MSVIDSSYSVVFGMAIARDGVPGFFDAGLRYGTADYRTVVGLQAAFNEHADEILAAMQPLRDKLVALGITVVETGGTDGAFEVISGKGAKKG